MPHLAGRFFPGPYRFGAGLAQVVVAYAAALQQGGGVVGEGLGAAGAGKAVVRHFEQLEAVPE